MGEADGWALETVVAPHPRLGKRERGLRVHEFRRDLLLAQNFERGAVERAEDRRDGRLAFEPLALRLSDALGDSLRDSGLDERQMRQDLVDAPGLGPGATRRVFRRQRCDGPYDRGTRLVESGGDLGQPGMHRGIVEPAKVIPRLTPGKMTLPMDDLETL